MARSNITLREVSPSDADALARILTLANGDAFRDRVPDHCLAFSVQESADNWRRSLDEGIPDDDVFLVAQVPDMAVVGYAWGGPGEDPVYRGDLRQIAVLPSRQRQGIGGLLLREVARRLAAQGLSSMRVEVLRANPNRTFYESLNARYVEDIPYDWDGFRMTMCVYGWNDTSVLLRTYPDGKPA